SERMNGILHGAIAGTAVVGADIVAVLGELERSPAEFARGGDDAGRKRCLANAAGMPADYNQFHRLSRLKPARGPARALCGPPHQRCRVTGLLLVARLKLLL